MLVDNHGREIKYLRLAVTDRCNLRCFYCMPEQGLNFSPKHDLLSYEEMLRLVNILAQLGISKVRVTGGEPMLRKDILPFLGHLKQIPGIENVSITSNGTNLINHVDYLESIGIDAINLSLDTLDKERFHAITRRDEFDTVMATLDRLIRSKINVKINMVVMESQNLMDIAPMARLTMQQHVDVRFIEEMPFNGGSKGYQPITWDHDRIRQHLIDEIGPLRELANKKGATAVNYQLPQAIGNIGIIPAYTRTICGECDRIRLTPKGELRTCLYASGGLSFRDLMRSGASDEQITESFVKLVDRRAKNGFEAEKQQPKNQSFESMATIGG